MTNSTMEHKKKKIKKTLLRLAVLLFWIGVWQGAFMAVNEKYGEILLVSPWQVLRRLSELVLTADFWHDAFLSLLRISEGYLLGVVLAVLLAVAITAVPLLDELFKPVLSLIKATPVASFILLALVWIKKDFIAVFIALLMVVPVIWSNVSQGIRSTDKNLLEMAKVYGFSRGKKLRMIYLNTVMPYFISAATSALGFAWKAGIAAEVISRPEKSIGYHLYRAKMNIETADLFAWTAVVILLSVIFEKIVVFLLGRVRRKGEKIRAESQ